MKLFIVNFIFQFASMLNAQSINVEYEVTVNRSSVIKTTRSVYYLVISNNKSIYYNDGNNIDIFPNIDWKPEIIDQTPTKISLKIDDNIYAAVFQDYYYKNYELNKLIFNDSFFKEQYIVYDSINLFNWNIIPDFDTTILNYKCSKALCTFRGREYEAFFSEDLLNYGGPWKFDGLPGLILSIHSVDDYFIINPLRIDVKNSKKEISNPYINREAIISWDSFKENAYNKAKKILNYIKTDLRNGESSSILIKDRIENIGFTKLSTDDL